MGSIQPITAQTISFSPTRVFFEGNPEETVTEIITISNSGKDTYEFIVHIQDWKRDSLGNKLYFPMATLPNSNAKYIGLSTTNLKVEPGERKTFPISISIPKEVNSSSTNSMLFFTQTNALEPNTKGKSGMGIKTSLELGIQLFYTPHETKIGDLDFLAFEHQNETVQGKQVKRLAIKLKNTGEVNKDSFIKFELTNKLTGEEIKIKSIPIAIMPLDYQWVYCPIADTLAEGEYLAVAILESGADNNLKVAEKNIYVKK